MRIMKYVLFAVALFLTTFARAQAQVTWDQQSLIIDGRRVVPAMGEIH